MKITRENLKNIVREAMVEENAYQEFFKKALEKTGKSIPQMSDEEKKAFFNKIDSAWKGKGEKKESVDVDIDEEAVVVSKRTPEGNIVSKLKEELEEGQSPAQKAAFEKMMAKNKKKDGDDVDESINELANAETVDALTAIIGAGGVVGGALALDKLMTALEKGKMGSKGKAIAKTLRGLGKTFAGAGMKGESVNEGPSLKIKNSISKKEWNKTHKNFKSIIDGVHYVMKLTNQGTALVPVKIEESVNEGDDFAGWIAIDHRGKKIEIKKGEAKDLYNAKLLAIKKLKVPKSKIGLLAIKPAVNESTNERMGSDKGAVGNANFNNRLKAMRDAKNSFVAFIDTNKGKKLLKVFKTQQTAKQFTKKNMDKLLNTKGVESVGTMPKKEWDAKEAKYAIESVNEVDTKKANLPMGILNESEAEKIASLTGLRAQAVKKFIDDNNINDRKLLAYLKIKGPKSDSTAKDIATAIVGKAGNKYSQGIIKAFKNESVNEAKTYTPKQVKQALEKMVKQLKAKWKQKGGYENFGQRELDKFKKTFGYSPYGSSDEREISDLIDSFEDWAMDYSG